MNETSHGEEGIWNRAVFINKLRSARMEMSI